MYLETIVDKISDKETIKLGFTTSVKSKPFIIDTLRADLREKSIQINDKITLREIMTFVVEPNGSMAADAGCHDDTIMSLALANYVNDGTIQTSRSYPRYVHRDDLKYGKYKKLGEQDVLTILDANIKQAVGYFDSKLSTERQRVMEYYTAKLPFPHHDGNSKFVSQDVYNAIESMKAALLEVFASEER